MDMLARISNAPMLRWRATRWSSVATAAAAIFGIVVVLAGIGGIFWYFASFESRVIASESAAHAAIVAPAKAASRR